MNLVIPGSHQKRVHSPPIASPNLHTFAHRKSLFLRHSWVCPPTSGYMVVAYIVGIAVRHPDEQSCGHR